MAILVDAKTEYTNQLVNILKNIGYKPKRTIRVVLFIESVWLILITSSALKWLATLSNLNEEIDSIYIRWCSKIL